MSHCQPAQRLSILFSIHHEMIELWNQLAELFEMQPNDWTHMGKGFTKPKHFKEKLGQLTTQGYLFLFTIWPGHRFSTKPV